MRERVAKIKKARQTLRQVVTTNRDDRTATLIVRKNETDGFLERTLLENKINTLSGGSKDAQRCTDSKGFVES